MLIVEDDDNNMELISYILEYNDYETIGVPTGQEGCTLAEEHVPDFIILDIQLPDMNGIDVLQRMRSTPEGKDIPVIAMASYAMAGDRESMLVAGCNGYIERPIDAGTSHEPDQAGRGRLMMRILVVDNDDDARLYLSDLLETRGYTVVEATNGREGLDAAKASPPDMIISDIMMPDMDGFDLCRRIKSDKLLKAIPFVFYSATYTDSRNEQFAMEIGASRFIVKPKKVDELIEDIREVLQEHETDRLPVPTRTSKDKKALDGMDMEVVTRKLRNRIEELEKTVEAQKASEAVLKATLESTQDGVLVISNDGMVSHCNSRFQEMWSIPSEVMALKEDRKLIEFVLPQLVSPDEFVANIGEIYGHSRTSEGLLHLKDGRVFERYSAPHIQDGRETGRVWFFRDVTDRERAEQSLREGEERFREVFENMGSGVAIYAAVDDGEDFVFKDINPAGARIGKTPRADHSGRSVLDLYPGVRELGLFDVFKEAWRTGKPQQHPMSTYKDEHISLWVENYVCKLPSGEIVAVYDDITREKQAEQRFREEKEFTDTALDAQMDTFFLFEPATGKALRWNRSFRDTSGYTDEEIAEMPAPGSYYSPEDLQRVKLFTEEVMSEGIGTIELELICKDGRKVPTEYRVSAVNDEQGQPKYFISVGRDITDRKRAEEERARLTAILETTSDLVSTATPEGRVTFMNVAGKKMLGWPEGQESYDQIISDVHPDWAYDIVTNRGIPSAIEHGVWEGETALIGPEGNDIPISQVIMAHRSAENELLYLSTIMRDITERKQAEEARRESEERYRTLVENIQLGITMISPDYSVVTMNTAQAKMLNKPVSDFIGKPCFAEFEKRDGVCPHCPGARAMSTGLPQEAETEGVRDDGSRFSVRICAFPVMAPTGKATGFIEVVEDITERKQAEEALAASERLYRTLFESAGDAIAVFRETPRGFEYADANARELELLGCQREELRGRSPVDFSPPNQPDGRSSSEKAMEVVMATLAGETQRFEWKHCRKDGTLRDSAVTLTPVEVAGETLILGIRRDITEVKQAEAEREKLIAHLEAQNEELERFAYTISHDLRTPLITINTYSGAVRQGLREGNAEQAEKDAGRIIAAGNTMFRLLDDVLELSRIGRVVNPPVEVSLGILAEEVVKTLQPQISSAGVQMKIASDLPTLRADRTRLLEVLLNLVENAIKYMGGQEDPRIEIGARQEGHETVCYVRDNGIGIDPQYHEKVFGLFDQLDQKVEGSGVGLALVKRIIEVHGGRIWCESGGEGCGSTFFFAIPSKQEAAAHVV